MEYPHPVFKHSVEDFVGISDERNDVHPGPFDDARGHPRVRCYVRYDLTNTTFDGGSHCLAKHTTFRGHFVKVGRCALAELDLHSRRKDLNAASTSSSLATPLRSASSSAANSSWVA